MHSVSRPKWIKVKNLHRIESKEAMNLETSKKIRSMVHFVTKGCVETSIFHRKLEWNSPFDCENSCVCPT